MELDCYPSLSSVSLSSSFENWVARLGEIGTSVTVALLAAFLTVFFALVGSLLGAMTGALIGQKTESGFVRGAAIGALSGAVFSLEVYESSRLLWQTDERRTSSLLYLLDVSSSLLSGRLIRDQVSPAVQRAVLRQMGDFETFFEEVLDSFDTDGATGLSADLVEKIPKIRITSQNDQKNSSCSVCLQDFELGEMVRSLPNCHHIFHLPCIDKWLINHGSCPLCRSDL